MIALRPARPEEVQILTDLCLRSKAVWGYDEAFMSACREELTLIARDFDLSTIHVATNGDQIIGVAQLGIDDADAHLHKLFIEPAAIRTGAGRQLFGWAVAAACERHAARLWIEADPDAANFYRRMGATDDGVVPSESIPGRVLPRLRLDLQEKRDD